MTKFYVNEQGQYLGGFDGTEPPAGAIEVAAPPDDGRQVWQFPGWSPVPSARPEEIRARLVQIDVDSVRPLRAIAAGVDTQFDRDKLAALDTEAAALRAELAALPT